MELELRSGTVLKRKSLTKLSSKNVKKPRLDLSLGSDFENSNEPKTTKKSTTKKSTTKKSTTKRLTTNKNATKKLKSRKEIISPKKKTKQNNADNNDEILLDLIRKVNDLFPFK